MQNESLRNKTTTSKSNCSNFQKSIAKMEQINQDLDELCKITNEGVFKVMGKKDYKT